MIDAVATSTDDINMMTQAFMSTIMLEGDACKEAIEKFRTALPKYLSFWASALAEKPFFHGACCCIPYIPGKRNIYMIKSM